jgi:hypothetical protein
MPPLSDGQKMELYERIVHARARHATAERAFIRGWNAGLDFVLEVLREFDREAMGDDGDQA